MDRQNNSLTPTYIKRARQLVKKGRAHWLDESTICLTQPEEDFNSMKAIAKEQPILLEAAVETNSAAIEPETKPQAASPQAAPPQAELVDDGAIRDLAKRRLSAKRSLIGQALDYLLIIVVVIMLANLSYGEAMTVAFFFCAFWGLRLAYRTYKFAQPSFNGGIAAYLRKRKEDQLEAECNRLKKMGTEYVTTELSR